MIAPYLYKKLNSAYDTYNNYKAKTQAPNKQEMVIKEKRLFETQGLKDGKDFYLVDVPYLLNDHYYYLHTFIAKTPQKSEHQSVVLVHGYGGSLTQYYRIIPHLIQNYKVYAIDLPGLGLSSKKKSSFIDYDRTLNYFVDSIEEWRKSLGINSMILIGHSFGGYISAQYAVKYEERIKQLILLSPAGCTTFQDEDIAQSRKNLKKKGWILQKVYLGFENIWKNRMTPPSLYKKWFGPALVNQYCHKKFKLSDNEFHIYVDFMENMLKQEEGSERGLFKLFHLRHFPKIEAYEAIEEIYKKEGLIFFFGDIDWMDQQGAKNMEENGLAQIKIVKGSGHQLSLDNPNELLRMLNELMVH